MIIFQKPSICMCVFDIKYSVIRARIEIHFRDRKDMEIHQWRRTKHEHEQQQPVSHPTKQPKPNQPKCQTNRTDCIAEY